MRDWNKCNIDDLLTKEIGMFLPLKCYGFVFENSEIGKQYIFSYRDMTNKEVLAFIKKNQKSFDRKAFIFACYLYLTKVKKTDGIDLTQFVTDKEEKIKRMREYLINNPTLYIDDSDGNVEDRIYDSRNYTGLDQKRILKKEFEEGTRRLNKIDSTLGLEQLGPLYSFVDLQNVFIKDKKMGVELGNEVYTNIYKQHGLSDTDIYMISTGEIDESHVLNDKTFVDEGAPFVLDILKRFRGYVDWDKFLLCTAYKVKALLDNNPNFSDENIKMFTYVMLSCYKLIENENVQAAGQIESLFEGKATKKFKYSYKELERDLTNRLIENMYCSDYKLAEMKQKVLSGESEFASFNKDSILDILNLTTDEIKICMKNNPKNMLFLFEHGRIAKNILMQYLMNTDYNEDIFYRIACNEESCLDENDILKLYMNGKIPLEKMQYYKDEFIDELTEQKLIENFRKLKTVVSDEEKLKLERFIALYRAYKVSNASLEDRIQLGDNVVLALGEDMQEEEFIDLYKRNLITINNLIEWNGESFVNDMFSNGQLRPNDVKNLLMSKKLDLYKIMEKLSKGNLSDEEKVTLIFSTFDQESDEVARQKLLQTLEIGGDFSLPSNSSNSHKNDVKDDETQKPRKKIYIFDPCYKMQLLTMLDKEYSYSLSKDGHLIIEFPNLNQVWIEKLFTRKYGHIESAVGAATYKMSADAFKAYNIVNDLGKVDRSKLYRLYNNGLSQRYLHTKNWGDTIKEAFDVKHSERYSEESKKEIDEIVEKLKRTRIYKEI